MENHHHNSYATYGGIELLVEWKYAENQILTKMLWLDFQHTVLK